MSLYISPINRPIQARINIPGSKSITNRALLLAALAQGESLLQNILLSDDSWALIRALQALGVIIHIDSLHDTATVSGCSGKFPQPQASIDCRDAGTVARFLLSVCANQLGRFQLDGSARLRQRPLRDLIDVLRAQGAIIFSDALPLTIASYQTLIGGDIFIAGDVSSQFLSGLLMSAPYFQRDVILTTHNLVSKPYVDMTCAMMRDFGVDVLQHQSTWTVKASQCYRARQYWIESDFSSASYFFAAAAVTAGDITMLNMSYKQSIQGDKYFLDVLKKMGCVVQENSEGLRVIGPEQLAGIAVDMADFSDTMMTLAAIAPFANSPTRIFNIANTRVKESDRIRAMANNLRCLGVSVEEEEAALTIFPACPHGGVVTTYNDHRIAMACSLIGLKVAGVIIDDESCVNKTFPEFFKKFSLL